MRAHGVIATPLENPATRRRVERVMVQGTEKSNPLRVVGSVPSVVNRTRTPAGAFVRRTVSGPLGKGARGAQFQPRQQLREILRGFRPASIHRKCKAHQRQPEKQRPEEKLHAGPSWAVRASPPTKMNRESIDEGGSPIRGRSGDPGRTLIERESHLSKVSPTFWKWSFVKPIPFHLAGNPREDPRRKKNLA